MKSLGVVAALPGEARCIAGARVRRGDPTRIADAVWLALSGIGPDRAFCAARSLISSGASALVSWGTAAGLHPDLQAGAIVLPRQVLSADGRRFSVDSAWRDRIENVARGPFPVDDRDIAETSVVLRGARDKADLHERTGAVAADMESGAIARAATEAGIGFAVVRVVLDPLALALPRAALRGIDDWGRVRPAAFLRGVLCRPAEVGDLLRVARGFRVAQRALSHVALQAGPDLMWTGLAMNSALPARH